MTLLSVMEVKAHRMQPTGQIFEITKSFADCPSQRNNLRCVFHRLRSYYCWITLPLLPMGAFDLKLSVFKKE